MEPRIAVIRANQDLKQPEAAINKREDLPAAGNAELDPLPVSEPEPQPERLVETGPEPNPLGLEFHGAKPKTQKTRSSTRLKQTKSQGKAGT